MMPLCSRIALQDQAFGVTRYAGNLEISGNLGILSLPAPQGTMEILHVYTVCAYVKSVSFRFVWPGILLQFDFPAQKVFLDTVQHIIGFSWPRILLHFSQPKQLFWICLTYCKLRKVKIRAAQRRGTEASKAGSWQFQCAMAIKCLHSWPVTDCHVGVQVQRYPHAWCVGAFQGINLGNIGELLKSLETLTKA